MEIMKKLMIIVALCMGTCTLWAQNEVSLVVSGEGKDKEEATFKALRSAIEQAYGTFVSANTTVLNDQLVADEIVSLSSGNIQKYEYVSENKMPNGNTFVTLSATVSIDKLVSFAESKGMEAELKGGLFAMNIKKMAFDKQAEEKAVENLCKQLETMLPNIIDYEIELENPKKTSEIDEDLYEVSFKVQPIISGINREIFYDLILKTLGEICLSKSEMINYEESGIDMYGIRFRLSPPVNSVPLSYYDFQLMERIAKDDNTDTSKYINFLNKYPNWFKKRMDSGYMVFRSKKTLESLLKFMNKFHLFYKNFTINDGSRTFNFRKKYYVDGIQQPEWLLLKDSRLGEYWVYGRSEYIPTVNVTSENDEGIYVIIENSMLAYDTFSLRIKEGTVFYLNDEAHSDFDGKSASFLSNEYFGDGVGGSFHTFLNETKGKILYPLNELSKISHISVSKLVDPFKDYLKDETTGIYYKFYDEIHKEAVRPKTGDLVGIHYSMRTEDAILIPMTKNEMVMDSVDKDDIYAAIRMMHVGDSATFIFNGQDFFDQIMTEEYPFGEEPLYLDIKLYGQISKEEFEKLKLQRKETEDSTDE